MAPLAGSTCDINPVETKTSDSADWSCGGSFNTGQLITQGYTEIVSICVSGDSPVGEPQNFEVTVPSALGDYLAFPTWDDYDPATDLFQLSVNNQSGPLVNDALNDGSVWPYEFDPTCSDYTGITANYAVIDGLSAFWWPGFRPTCDAQPFPPPPASPAPTGKVASGSQACVAGEADFDMAARRVFHSDGDEATVWLVPVLTEEASFPERAWLRELEVVDWGGATNLHYADFTDPLLSADWDLSGTEISKPTSGPTVVTFDVGEQPMSTMLGSEKIALTGSNTDLPKLHLEWSCQMDSEDPHAVAVPDRSGHVGVLPEASPIESRIVFWVADDGSDVHVAPEGRYMDYTEAELTTASPSGKEFTVYLPGYDATFSGRLVPFGDSYKLHDGEVVYDGETTTLSTKTLTEL